MKRKRENKKERRYANITEQKFIAAEQKWRCNMCHDLLTAHFDLDHIIPWSAGGRTTLDNLQALCTNCHRKKTMFERQGICTHCLKETYHSKFFPCPKTKPPKKRKKRKKKRKKTK